MLSIHNHNHNNIPITKDSQAPPLHLCLIAGDYSSVADIVSKIYHNMRFCLQICISYQLSTIFNKMGQAELKKKQLQKERSSIYEISKSRGKRARFEPESVDYERTSKTLNENKAAKAATSKCVSKMTKMNERLDGNSVEEFQDNFQRLQPRKLLNSVHNKCKPSFQRVQAGTPVANVRVLSKKRIGQTRLENEEKILSRVIQYERQIGREPQLLDLLCILSSAEIEAVRNDLEWLYPSMFVPVDEERVVPEMVIA
jgi:hypothetical protein